MPEQPIHDYADDASPAASDKVFMTDASETTLKWVNQDDLPEFANKSDKVMAGDQEITGSANGLILESPDATRWRVTVDNSGVLVVTSL